MEVNTVSTTPFEGQRPGTSGLRKKVPVFQQPNYLENFIQSTFDCLQPELTGKTLVLSGDGRFYNSTAVWTILRMMAANGVKRAIVGVDFVVSTPAVSMLIRERKTFGGIILTASHNPGGPQGDFGVKSNIANGGPAPSKLTEAIYKRTQTIAQYKIAAQQLKLDVSKPGEHQFGGLTIEVVDACALYATMLKRIFDFPALRAFVQRRDFSFVYDAMHGVAGPFAREVFVKDLGASPSALLNAVPKEDFGGGHPDPNLTYAAALVKAMGLDAKGKPLEGCEGKIADFGAAADGDADRNMILGRQFFVTPSDSVAIIAAHAQECIPYFKSGLAGVARSMPTSCAIDRVAAKLGVRSFEVPTGWKYFGNLMQAKLISLCGEESFGTSSDHIFEKDGIWAVCAWLSILAHANKGVEEGKRLVSVEDIVRGHWRTYGRNYYSRYDYEQVDAAAARELMASLVDLTKSCVGTSLHEGLAAVRHADEFEYKDPVDNSLAQHQGIRFLLEDGSRIIFRLSGTGSVGATVRLYVEKYEQGPASLDQDTQTAVAPLIAGALKAADLTRRLQRTNPTAIT